MQQERSHPIRAMKVREAHVLSVAASLGTVVGVSRCCVGGDWLFLLLNFRSGEGLASAVVSIHRKTWRVGGVHKTSYIKHDNGGGTLHCLADGSKVALGQEFMLNVFQNRFGQLESLTYLDTEQETQAGCFWGRDCVLYLDPMTYEGLVLARLEEGTQRVLPVGRENASWCTVDNYAVSPVRPVAAMWATPTSPSGGRAARTELVLLALPALEPFFRLSIDGVGGHSLLFHPSKPCVFVRHGNRLIEVSFHEPNAPTTKEAREELKWPLLFFGASGRYAYSAPDLFRAAEHDFVVERYDVSLERREALIVPCQPGGGALGLWQDDTLVVAQVGEGDGELALSLVQSP